MNVNKPRESRLSAPKDRRDLEEELRIRSNTLVERMKELECLHSVSTLFESKYVEFGEVFQRIADLLPTAWQFPEFACARITLKSRQYQSQNYREPRWRQQVDIVAGDERIGTIEVGYVEPFSENSEPVFLPEEYELLMTVARRLAETYSLKNTQLQLTTYQQHLRSLASEVTLAEERERRQLALHLHDSIGQGLAVAKLKLETLRHILPEKYHDRVQDILALIQQIIADTRSITADISPPILYELRFDQALVWLGDNFKKQFGLNVEVHCSGREIALGEGARVMLFRSIQELLTNVVKHAQATAVRIELQCEGNEAHACVTDDGVGFEVEKQSRYPSAAGGFGLFSIRERFAHLGGRMSVDSKVGAGTRVHLWIPVADLESSNR